MIELHSYITMDVTVQGRNGEGTVSYLDMFNTYVRPIAEKDFKIVLHCEEVSRWDILLRHRAKLMYASVLEAKDPVVWVDTDILFIRECADRLVSLLGDYDFLASDAGSGDLCCGIMIFKPSDKVLQLIERVVNDKVAFARGLTCDQEAFNRYRGTVKWGVLPQDEFFSTALWIGPVPKPGWRPTTEKLPSNIRTFHATSVFANEKIDILEDVKDMLRR